MPIPRLSLERTALLVIDVQERLLPTIFDGDRVVTNCAAALDLAKALGLPAIVTEQYTKGLGHSAPSIASSAAGHAHHGLRDGCSFVLRHDHGADAGRVGRAQAGTEIVRVLHAVEDEHERVLFAFEHRGNVSLLIDAHLVVGAGVTILTGDGWLGWTVGAHEFGG